MKTTLELNMGLLRNTDNQPNNVTDIDNTIQGLLGKHDFKLVNAVGDWGSEETYVARIELKQNNDKLLNSLLKGLCRKFNQDAIAYMLNGVGYMVFNHNYKGEKFDFNINYFERF
jgi:hypothetical protein